MKLNITTTLCALFCVMGTYAQNWHFVGPSTGIAPTSEAAIEINSSGDLFLAYNDPNESGKITVLKFNDQTMVWDTLGAPGIGFSGAFDIKIETHGNSQPSITSKFDDGNSTNIQVYEFNGSSWDFYGPIGGIETSSNAKDYDLKVNSLNEPCVVFDNASSAVGYFGLTVFNAETGSQIGPSPDAGGDFAYSVALALFDYNFPIVSWEFGDISNYYNLSYYNGSAYNVETSMGNFPYDTKMAYIYTVGNEHVTTTAWREENSTDDIFVYDYNLSSGTTNGSQQIYTGNGAVTGLDYFGFDYYQKSEYTNLFFVLDETSGSTNSELIMHTKFSASMSTLSSGFTPSSGSVTYPDVETHGDVYVVSYVYNGKVYVKENAFSSISFQNSGNQYVVCEGDSASVPAANASNYFLQVMNDDFYDHSQATITYHSSNQAVISDADMTAVTNNDPHIGIQVNTTGNVTAPTWVYIDATYSFAGVPYLSVTHFDSILVKPKVNLQFTPPAFCSNDVAVNLNNYATPHGTHWKINTFNYSPIFYPQSIANNSIYYEYTAPNGCTSIMDTTIFVGTSPEFTITKTPANCNDNSGSASVNVSAGASPFSYQWSTGDTTSSINNLSAGLYFITVTGSDGCKRSKPAPISSGSISVTGTVIPASCNGSNDGSIDVSVTGGSGNLSYYWTHGAYNQDLNSLQAGPYEISVTDETGCVATASFVVPEPAPIGIALDATAASCTVDDGAVNTTITGGNGPFTYNWEDNSGASISTTKNLTNVGADAYTITVTDNSGCVATQTIMLSNTAGPQVAIDTIVNATCSSLGNINVNIISPNGIVSTVWNDGSTNEDLTAPQGQYNLTVTDNNGCVGMFEASIDVVEPMAASICMVTVDSATNTNLILWKKPADNTIDHYNIYRETAQAGLYQLLDSVDYDSLTVYNDLGASPKIRSWRYKISSVNSCGGESELSDYHKTIHLSISEGLPGDYNLAWDDYEGFVYPQFDLYRYTNANGWELLQSMPTNLHSYTDTPPSTAGLDYIISIASPNDCTPEKAQNYNSSRSNKANGLMIPGQGGSTTGIVENNGNSVFKLYPNPNTGIVNVYWGNDNTQYTIFDIQGKQITRGKLLQGKTVINLSRVKKGMYFIQINGKTNKIVVQ